jgi:hypothetical protein
VTQARRATAIAWYAVAVLALAGAVLTVLAPGPLLTSDTISNLATAPAAVRYATLGALVVRRAGSVIGWFVLGAGACTAVMGHPRHRPAGMADRLAAVGGTLRVDSTPGSGTTVSGTLPVAELARATDQR